MRNVYLVMTYDVELGHDGYEEVHAFTETEAMNAVSEDVDIIDCIEMCTVLEKNFELLDTVEHDALTKLDSMLQFTVQDYVAVQDEMDKIIDQSYHLEDGTLIIDYEKLDELRDMREFIGARLEEQGLDEELMELKLDLTGKYSAPQRVF